jgi:hypothetical protein
MRGHREVLSRAGGRILVVGLCLLPLGCGSSGTISGKVFYNGRAVPGGAIVFFAEGNRAIVSTPIENDGSYRADKVPPGSAKIAIQLLKPLPMGKMMDKTAFLPNVQGKTTEQRETSKPREYLWIPEKYGDPEKSGLTLQVRGGPQEFDIKLEGPAQHPGRGSASSKRP